VLALTLVDPDFGKPQLKLMLREQCMHPNGQIPAYEWNLGDVNSPVHVLVLRVSDLARRVRTNQPRATPWESSGAQPTNPS
jgi:hypothetical protein